MLSVTLGGFLVRRVCFIGSLHYSQNRIALYSNDTLSVLLLVFDSMCEIVVVDEYFVACCSRR